jgi:hypothetical protein
LGFIWAIGIRAETVARQRIAACNEVLDLWEMQRYGSDSYGDADHVRDAAR